MILVIIDFIKRLFNIINKIKRQINTFLEAVAIYHYKCQRVKLVKKLKLIISPERWKQMSILWHKQKIKTLSYFKKWICFLVKNDKEHDQKWLFKQKERVLKIKIKCITGCFFQSQSILEEKTQKGIF